MSGKLFQNQQIERILERQMSQWELSRSVKDKSDVQAHLTGGEHIDYITISRETGSGGVEIARILSDLMKWHLYDKEILNYMAQNMRVHVRALETVDERTISWINDWLMPLFSTKSQERVGQLSYYKHLGKVLMVIGRHGRAIIVGRAAGLILPRKRGLSIRVTAPFELRCKRYAQENQIQPGQATSIVKKADKEQRHFVEDFLDKDISDSKYYDIVFNTEKFSSNSVAKLIWRAFDQRETSEQEQSREKAK